MSYIRASMRRRMERLSGEAQLLAMAMLVCLVGFLTGLPRELARVPEDAKLQAVGWLFTGAVFFGPLLLIGLAALSHLIASPFGGQGQWQTSRLALFWALVLAIPLLIVGEIGPSWLGFFCMTGTAWIWAETLSEAHGFAQSWKVFLAMMVVPVLLATQFLV